MINLIVIVILVVIISSAIFAIRRSKKSGRKCIGCPEGGNCSGCCADCNNKTT